MNGIWEGGRDRYFLIPREGERMGSGGLECMNLAARMKMEERRDKDCSDVIAVGCMLTGRSARNLIFSAGVYIDSVVEEQHHPF